MFDWLKNTASDIWNGLTSLGSSSNKSAIDYTPFNQTADLYGNIRVPTLGGTNYSQVQQPGFNANSSVSGVYNTPTNLYNPTDLNKTTGAGGATIYSTTPTSKPVTSPITSTSLSQTLNQGIPATTPTTPSYTSNNVYGVRPSTVSAQNLTSGFVPQPTSKNTYVPPPPTGTSGAGGSGTSGFSFAQPSNSHSTPMFSGSLSGVSGIGNSAGILSSTAFPGSSSINTSSTIDEQKKNTQVKQIGVDQHGQPVYEGVPQILTSGQNKPAPQNFTSSQTPTTVNPPGSTPTTNISGSARMSIQDQIANIESGIQQVKAFIQQKNPLPENPVPADSALDAALNGMDKVAGTTFKQQYDTLAAQSGLTQLTSKRIDTLQTIDASVQTYQAALKDIKDNPELPAGVKAKRLQLAADAMNTTIQSLKGRVDVLNQQISDATDSVHTQMSIFENDQQAQERAISNNRQILQMLLQTPQAFANMDNKTLQSLAQGTNIPLDVVSNLRDAANTENQAKIAKAARDAQDQMLQVQAAQRSAAAAERTAANTVSPQQKIINDFNQELANRTALDKAGTREQFIRQLQAQFPQIDKNSIAEYVYGTYPDNYNQ